ncbi:MAG: hypothetical protein L6Q54_12230 [Leptospiraceae bacterium]|nr:hypothetical protein [Leptospiraceae bacterium]MCK6381999.1 hypothetical protein [Leptospiraceae bacterium]NUM40370.1 hypothetical protein [Leptospiraceae bacterium]
MRKVLQISILLILSFVAIQVMGQTNQPATAEKKDEVTSDKYGDLKDYYPLAIYDSRFKVGKISFVRRHAGNGKGEFMDAQIEIENHVYEPLNLSIYVLAVNESDSIDKDARNLVPYPAWRNFDPKKVNHIVNFSNLVPENIDVKEIWGEKRYNERKAEIEARQLRGEKVKIGEPSLSEYVLYLSRNPQKSMAFTLYGEMGPPSDKIILHNLKSPGEDEERRQINTQADKHNYTIYNARYQTTIFSHHYTQYRPNYFTFNKVVILIFDQAKQTNKLVYRNFLDIGNLKLTN